MTSAGISQGLEQMDPPSRNMEWLDNFFTGGNLGAQFGDLTMINISPLLGYRVTERVSVGTRGIYQYVNWRPVDFTSHVLGGALFGRYFIMENLFAHAEYEVINGHFGPSGGRSNIESFFLGGGYLYQLGGNTSLGVMALYDFINSRYSPYRNPIIRIGFNIGL